MSSDEYPVLRRGKLQSDGSLHIEGVLGGVGSPLFILGSERPGDTANVMKLILTPTPFGDPGCSLNPGDVLAECQVTPKDQSRVESTNILRAFEVIRSKLAGDQSHARLAEVRQIFPTLTPKARKVDSEPEQVSLSRFGVQPWEILMLKVRQVKGSMALDISLGGFRFAVSEFCPNSFGDYCGNLRFLDGYSKLEPRTQLCLVDRVSLENGDYVGHSIAGFEVVFSRPGTVSDVALQLRQTSTERMRVLLPRS